MKIVCFRERMLSFPFILTLFLIANSVYSQSVTLNGTSQYVALDNNASLHLTNFTLEAWIKIEGTGIITTNGTGTGGHSNIVPIITKGRAEAESAAVDVNYFMGYDLTTKKLLADFEDNATSANHPVTGNATIGNCWTHVAASFNTSTNTWKLYVNGVLDQTTVLGASYIPQSLSNVNACIGSAFNSTGTASGFFNGRIDEVRIWNVVRTDAEVLANYNSELISGTGLVSRWGFNEGTGTTAANSLGGGSTGILTNSPLWKPGFNQVVSTGSTLDFNGTSNYVTFGTASGLNTSIFTLEAWIRIEGAGTTTSSGTGGLDGSGVNNPLAIPIISKGRGEAESPANLNMNYFLGITSGNILAADFEEATGPNHPVVGTTAIPLNVWTHIAATYEPVTAVWNLYINGVLDKTLDIGSNINPVNTSIQHAAIGTAMTSAGVAGGYFNGKIDEVRIWNVVRTGTEISTNYNSELTSGTGLIGRWGFNEGCGLTAGNSIGGGVNGTLSSSTGPVWSEGNYDNQPPNQPINPSPANNAGSPSTSPNICTTVSDPNGGNLTVRFYGRKKVTAGAKFTIIGLPDTQFYTEEVPGTNSGGGGHNGIFKAQTQWIADHRVDSNIAFVVQLGDCVQNGDNPPGADNEIEWKRADTSMKKIENPNVPITDGIPYGICVGNHDQGVIGDPNSTNTYYNQYFGEARFSGRAYYGGHYGTTNNDNHYELFSSGGIDFIHISIEYYPDGTTSPLQSVLDWADALLKAYPNRKGILSSHNMLGTGNPASFQGPGQKIYDDLKDNPNLILMLAGHVPGEGRRTDVFNGNTIHTVMADYQNGYTNGGNGYLRIMQFLPDQNLMKVKTYSPYNNIPPQTGSGSEFSLSVSLTAPFTLIGQTIVSSGSIACMNWSSLDQFSDYEWYVEVSDGLNTTTGPVWTFTTPANSPLPVNLINFTAKAENNDKVKISWTTTYERNNNRFEVQRSKDGLNYNTIGIVAGNNNSNSLQDYSIYDYQPYKGVSFYRLKQVDNDQQFAYSGIARVNISEMKNKIEIYPNPVSGNSFMVELKDNLSGPVLVTVYDIMGRMQMQQQFVNIQSIIINHHLSPGTYLIKITAEGLTENKKLIIE